MATNPFDIIDERLRKIESLLINIQSSQNEKQVQSQEKFKYIPIQDIFNKKICSKPCFYDHLKKGEFSLYKFGNKSFVEEQEFLNAFHKVKFK